jgi:hypothetical protein
VTEALTVDPYAQEHITCVMPGCKWVLDVPPVQADPQREALRRGEIERACNRHVASHPIAQWVRALADALADLDRLRGPT